MANRRRKRTKVGIEQLPLRYGEMCWNVAGLMEAHRHAGVHRHRMVLLLGAVWQMDGGECHKAIVLADVCRVGGDSSSMS